MDEQLFKCVESGNLKRVKQLVSQGANLNVKHGHFDLLYIASENGHLPIVKFLVSQGADINSWNSLISALHGASMKGHLRIVKFLVSQGADVNRQSYIKTTPLHEAAHSGKVSIVKHLLANGAYLYALNEHGKSVLNYAISNRKIQMLKYLLLLGMNPNFGPPPGSENYESRHFPLFEAINTGDIRLVRILVSKGADVNMTFIIPERYRTALDTPLIAAARDFDTGTMKYLVSKGAALSRDAEELCLVASQDFKKNLQFFIGKFRDVINRRILMEILYCAHENHATNVIEYLNSLLGGDPFMRK